MSPARRKKPNKKKRSPQDEDGATPIAQSEPKGREEKRKQNYQDNVDPRQRLRDKIKAMQKDRAKGSTTCEENANHEY